MSDKKQRIENIRHEIQVLNNARTYARMVLSADTAVCIALFEEIEKRVAQVRYMLDEKNVDICEWGSDE